MTDFLAEAQRLLRLNQFSEAMIFYYSWQLVTLDHAGAIELEAGKTNRQYLREAAQKRADLSDLFAQSTHQFEEAFYGQIPTQREDFLALWKRREEFAPPASPRRRA